MHEPRPVLYTPPPKPDLKGFKRDWYFMDVFPKLEHLQTWIQQTNYLLYKVIKVHCPQEQRKKRYKEDNNVVSTALSWI